MVTWSHFQSSFLAFPQLQLSFDYSRMGLPDGYLKQLEKTFDRVFHELDALEKGAIANPDEKRQVGHYWLRNSALAPTKELATAIDSTLASLLDFAGKVHAGSIASKSGAKFTELLVVGIGGSALGPELVARALSQTDDKMAVHFLDNTDPDGFDYVLDRLKAKLATTLVVVISKSGGTKETRNAMLETKWAFERAGLSFEAHAVAVTGVGSELDKQAQSGGWLARFPMWDWVGGRTSELSAVGLLPAALQGLDVKEMLAGAKAMDDVTRVAVVARNPAAILATLWYFASNGRGEKAMVVLPYKDRLDLFSKYLQQLIMESLGKEYDLDGKPVNQGLTVYGNKGSTDQHAYIQQLREGPNNFFVGFISVLRERAGEKTEVEPGVTSGDYLQGFLLGTRQALFEKGRTSFTLTIDEVNARSIGMLIALFERATTLYASLVGINAFHQPGVEAGKKAAGNVLAAQNKIVAHLAQNPGAHTAAAIGHALGIEPELVYTIGRYVSANGRLIKAEGTDSPASATFRKA